MARVLFAVLILLAIVFAAFSIGYQYGWIGTVATVPLGVLGTLAISHVLGWRH